MNIFALHSEDIHRNGSNLIYLFLLHCIFTFPNIYQSLKMYVWINKWHIVWVHQLRRVCEIDLTHPKAGPWFTRTWHWTWFPFQLDRLAYKPFNSACFNRNFIDCSLYFFVRVFSFIMSLRFVIFIVVW